MRSIHLLSLMLSILFLSSKTTAQSTISTPSSTGTTSVSLTPAMSSSSVAAYFSALATTAPQQPGNGPSAGDAGSSSGSGTSDSDAGASGGGSSGIELSKGGLIAIVVVIVVVVIFGITSSILYWQAKKRSWEVRKTIRRSAKRVATALTPRRTTFPKEARNSRGLMRIDEVPPTPRKSSISDVEKANSKMKSFEMTEPPKHSKWGRKFGR